MTESFNNVKNYLLLTDMAYGGFCWICTVNKLVKEFVSVQEDGRLQILNIHTRKMKSNGKLSDDVDLAEFAQITKVRHQRRVVGKLWTKSCFISSERNQQN